jgi:hypothetical protein
MKKTDAELKANYEKFIAIVNKYCCIFFNEITIAINRPETWLCVAKAIPI